METRGRPEDESKKHAGKVWAYDMGIATGESKKSPRGGWFLLSFTQVVTKTGSQF